MTFRTMTAALGLLGAAAFVQIASAADPILIGAPITMTPPGPVIFGSQVKQGTDLALKIINDEGGVLGRKLEILYEDHQGLPERARSATEKLITKDNVSVITGVELSPVVAQAIEVAHQYNVPLCNVNGWNDAIRLAGYPQVFNPNNFSSLVGLAAGKALKQMDVKRIALLGENTDNGKFVAEGIQKTLKELGWDGEMTITYIDRMGKDFLPAILPIKAFRPDVVVVQGQQPAAYILLKQIYEQGIAPTPSTYLFDVGALADAPDFWDGVGDAGKYMIEYGLYHPAQPLTARGDSFVAQFRTTYGQEVNRLALQGADCMFVIADAIKAAGNTEPDALIKAMQEGTFQGTRGQITFAKEPGIFFQQWKETPNVIFQFTETRQPVADTAIIGGGEVTLDPAKLAKP